MRIAMQVSAKASTGVKNAAIFLAARLKEAVSEPAPRKRVVTRLGDIYYRATVRAIAGAPPRKLSGKLRQSITYAMIGQGMPPNPRGRATGQSAVVGVKARSPKGHNYPKTLEHRGHPFMAPTVRKYRADLVRIVGRPLRVGRPPT